MVLTASDLVVDDLGDAALALRAANITRFACEPAARIGKHDEWLLHEATLPTRETPGRGVSR